MPITMQEEKSNFTSSQTRSVQQIGGDSNTNQQQSLQSNQDFTFRPLINFDSSTMLSRMSDFEDVSKDAYHVNDGDTFEMKMEVQEFKPAEIQVKISGNLVTIEGKQEMKEENNFRSRQFSKKFTIPQGVKAENITCTFTAQGTLKISAPIEQNTSQSQSALRNEANSSNVTSRNTVSRGFDDEFVLRPIRMSTLINRQEMTKFEDISKELCNTNDGKKFEHKIEVKGFEPSEIEVKITKNLVKIDGKHESEFASRSFHKEFTVPYGVKCESIQCSITEDGILTISAPVQPIAEALASDLQSKTRSVEQEVTKSQQNVSSSSVKTQQQQKQQQQTVHSDSTSSINSNASSIRDAVRRFDDDFMIRPIMDFENLMARDTRFEDVSKQICEVKDDKKFEMKLPCQDYKPEELQVKISNNMVTIEGNQKTEFSSRQFFKKFTIPQGVNPESITSSLSPQGVLTISAPIQIQNQQQQQASINSSTRVEQQTQQVKQQQTVQQQKQQQQTVQQQKQQQQTVHSDSTSSINSNISNTSSIRDAVRRFDDDFMIRPIMDFDNLFAKDSRFEDVSKQICEVKDDKKFEMKLPCQDYKSEELQVKISNNMVTIEGNQKTEFSSRQFFKKFTIPQGVNPESITSSLSPQGILTISAPIQIQNQQQQASINSSTRVEQQTQQVKQQQQTMQQQKQQQQTVHSDSTSSINSNTSSIRDAVRRFDDDFMIRPIMDFENLMARDTRFEDVSKQICEVKDDKKFEMKLEVTDYKPEELQVKISNNMVTIEGNQKTEFSSRQFFKKFTIPQGVNPESITSSLSPKGVLTISAPIQNQTQIQQGVNTSSTKSVTSQQQQVTSSKMTNVQQEQQKTALSDSTSSIASSILDSSSKRFENCVLRPIIDFDALLAKESHFEDISKQICQVNEGRKFETHIEVPNFQPEELQVKISNNMVTIEGKQKTEFSSREFFKKFSIPQGVKPESITSSLSPQGVLTISAPIEIQNSSNSNLNRNEQVSSTTSSSVTSSSRKEVQQQQQLQQQVSNVSNASNIRQDSTTSSILSNARDLVFKPKMNFSDSLVAMTSQFEDVSKEICHVNDGKHFEVKLAVQQFKPEEIDVKISNNMVTIEGKQEMREENNFQSRQFCKKFSIPHNVKAENITCSLSTDGKLTISAPVDQSQQQLTSSALTSSGSDNNSSNTMVVSQNQQQQVQQQQQQSGQTSTSVSSKKVSSTFSSTSSTTSSTQF